MGNTSEITNSVYETIKIITENTINNSDLPLTIEGKITSIEDAGAGIYLVEYLANTFTASANPALNYKVGDKVSVLISGGDFSKNKYIIGSIETLTANYVIEKEEEYYDISDNLIDNTDLISSEYSLSSYKDTILGGYDVYTKDKYKFGEQMLGYINDYNLFKLTIKVKTELDKKQQICGNYGVKLSIPVIIDNEKTYENFVIDITNMQGSPYNFLEWTTQSIVFKISNQYDADRKPYVTLFCEGFPQDSTKVSKKDIFFSGITFKAVNELSSVSKNGYSLQIKATEGEYFIDNFRENKILTPVLRVNGKTTKIPANIEYYWFVEDATVKLGTSYYSRYGGLGWKCLNDKTIVDSESGDVESFIYNTSAPTYTVNINDVSYATRYKCVIGYNGSMVSGVIELKNLNSENFVKLESDSANNTYVLGSSGRVMLTVYTYMKDITESDAYINNITYGFLRYDYNNNVKSDTDNYFKCEKKTYQTLYNDKKAYAATYSIPVMDIETLNKIYCIAKLNTIEGEREIQRTVGTASIVISTTEKAKYNVIVNNANKIYKYDADGDSPVIEAYDGPASSKVKDIQPLSFTIYDENGNELSDNQYNDCYYSWSVPKKSLFVVSSSLLTPTSSDDNYYYYSGKGNKSNLPYSIATKFDKTYASNGIELVIKYGEDVVKTSVSIFFTKDGETGTNGTTYAAILTSGTAGAAKAFPYGVDVNGITQKITLVQNSYNATETSSGLVYKWYCRNAEGKLVKIDEYLPTIYPRVYHDGEILDSSNYTVDYEIFDATKTNPCIKIKSVNSLNNGLLIEPIANLILDSTTTTCNIIKAKITVNNLSAMNDDTQIIYAYYPIEIVIIRSLVSIVKENDESGTKGTLLNQVFPSVDGGYFDVLYASDGTNPSYDSADFYLNNIDNDYYTVSWTTQHHLTQNVKTDSGNKIVSIVPDNKYSDGNTMNFVRADIVVNGDASYESLLAERALLIQERTQIQSAYETFKQKYIGRYKYAAYWNCGLAIFNKAIDYCNIRYNAISALRKIGSIISSNISAIEDSSLKADLTSLRVYSEITITKDYLSELVEDEHIEKLNKSDYDLTSIESLIIEEVNSAIDKFMTEYQKHENYKDTLISIKKISNISYEFDDDELVETITYETVERKAYLAFDDCRSYISDILGCFKDYDESFYNSLNAKVTRFYRNDSLANFNNYFQEIYDNILVALYEYSNSALIVKESEENDLKETKIDYDNSIKEKTSAILELDVIIDINHLQIVYIRPIVITTNRYEMANFNAWDGNKIYVDDNSSYIMTPQIGAGVKNSDNSFTGIVMGAKNRNNQISYGLFGFHEGQQTVLLSAENGSAIFGKAMGEAGQIVIDPTAESALLYSSKFFKGNAINNNTGLPTQSAYNQVETIIKSTEDKSGNLINNEGMLIDLSTPGIVFGSGNFKVTPEGYLVAKAGGSIGGWKIGIDTLYSQDYKEGTRGIQLDSNGRIVFGSDKGIMYSGKHTGLSVAKDGFYISGDGLSIGDRFKVSKEGIVEVGKGAVSGNNAKHWTINATTEDTYIKYNNRGEKYSVYISTGEICLGKNFCVTNEGVLKIGKDATSGTSKNHWTINGTSNGSAIYYSKGTNPPVPTVNTSNEIEGISSGEVYLGTDAIALGNKFYVDNKGKMIAADGIIAGWKISDNMLTRDNLSRKDSGDYLGYMGIQYDRLWGKNSDSKTPGSGYKAWQLNANGTAHFSELHLYTNPAGESGVFYLNGGAINGGTINGSTLVGCTINGYTVKPIVDKNGNTFNVLCQV